MTPEVLVKRYKEDISKHLDPNERDVLGAYINMEVDRKSESVVWFANFSDWFATISLAGVVVLLVSGMIGGIVYTDHETHYRNAYLGEKLILINEHKREIAEYKVQKEVCEKERDAVKDACIQSIIRDSSER